MHAWHASPVLMRRVGPGHRSFCIVHRCTLAPYPPIPCSFWKDENHVQGIWRKVTLDSYRSASPAWETVIDVDALPPPTTGTAATWVWHGSSPLDEGPGGAWDRTLVSWGVNGAEILPWRGWGEVTDSRSKNLVLRRCSLTHRATSRGRSL